MEFFHFKEGNEVNLKNLVKTRKIETEREQIYRLFAKKQKNHPDLYKSTHYVHYSLKYNKLLLKLFQFPEQFMVHAFMILGPINWIESKFFYSAEKSSN